MDKKSKKTMILGITGIALAVGLGYYLKDKRKKEAQSGNTEAIKKRLPGTTDVNFGV